MDKMTSALWAAKQLFDRKEVSGSTGNISFRDNDRIFISQSGSCFGLLDADSFAILSIHGEIIKGKPSKEWPMHWKLYQSNEDVQAVIHTHSFYSTAFSCVENLEAKASDLFAYTPYLNMQTQGQIHLVDYAPPGSSHLFTAFANSVRADTKAYILKNHGIVIGGEDMLKAFCLLEELEQTCRLYFFTHEERYATIKE